MAAPLSQQHHSQPLCCLALLLPAAEEVLGGLLLQEAAGDLLPAAAVVAAVGCWVGMAGLCWVPAACSAGEGLCWGEVAVLSASLEPQVHGAGQEAASLQEVHL